MRPLKTVLDFYINSSIHVALAVYALAWLTLLRFGVDYDKNILYFVFFASITGYNFVKFFGIAKFHHRSLTPKLKAIQMFSLICFVAMSYYLVKLETQTLIYVSIFGAATFLYAVPIVPKKLYLDEQQNLRSIGGLKIYIIALVWTGVTVFLPLVNNNYSINDDVIITAVQRFLFVIVLMLPFEIRDLSYDSLKLSTIPQTIGIKGTKIFGVLLLVVFFFLEYFKDEINTDTLPIHLVITVIVLCFLLFSWTRQNKYYTAFWVESLPMWWLLLMLVFS
ncbi:hypothetical protein [uncultured Psychroserpens sp.]|uniref:hypothetical protein n=1 Tax=uncultured Psychroserpens sp. TaxID=255436 RepID=UPI002635B41C|nr:hypothetical protein [uncultured Psychroserpens sp.]